MKNERVINIDQLGSLTVYGESNASYVKYVEEKNDWRGIFKLGRSKAKRSGHYEYFGEPVKSLHDLLDGEQFMIRMLNTPGEGPEGTLVRKSHIYVRLTNDSFIVYFDTYGEAANYAHELVALNPDKLIVIG